MFVRQLVRFNRRRRKQGKGESLHVGDTVVSNLQAVDAASPRRLTPAARGSLEVAYFTAEVASSPIHPRFIVGAACALVSVLLHVGLIGTAVWRANQLGTRLLAPHPPTTAEAYLLDESSLQDVANDNLDLAEAVSQLAALASPRLTRIAPRVELASFVRLLEPAMPDEAGERVAPIDGRYLGQITARIDRAWARPRTPIGAGRFLCQVRIEQDPAGNVAEVALERCNGTLPWQLSLVQAIESASPLPAPPDPELFVRALHLSFHAEPIEAAVAPASTQ